MTPEDRLYVHLPRAALHLRAGPADDAAEVRISVLGAEDEAAAQASLDARRLRMHQSEGTLRVTQEEPLQDADWWPRRAGIPVLRLEIVLPAAFNVDARASGGTIDIAGIEGRHALEVNGGTLRAEELHGHVEAFVRSGKLLLRNFSGQKATLHAYGSMLEAEAVRAETLQIRSTSRRVRLADVASATDLFAAGAAVTVQRPAGPLTARVYGAPLTVLLPASQAADLHLEAPRVVVDDALSFSGTQTGSRVRGQVNGGGAPLEARVAGGTIRCLP